MVFTIIKENFKYDLQSKGLFRGFISGDPCTISCQEELNEAFDYMS